MSFDDELAGLKDTLQALSLSIEALEARVDAADEVTVSLSDLHALRALAGTAAAQQAIVGGAHDAELGRAMMRGA